jgi:hypothetical protein
MITTVKVLSAKANPTAGVNKKDLMSGIFITEKCLPSPQVRVQPKSESRLSRIKTPIIPLNNNIEPHKFKVNLMVDSEPYLAVVDQ